MASVFIQILTQRHTIFEDIAQRAKDADENREREVKAAITIARSWKAYSAQKRLVFLRENVVKIQKSFRGVLGRRLFDMKLKQMLKTKRMTLYNAKATLIQKMWRGYSFRRFHFDYYHLKKYLSSVESQAHVVRQQLREYEKQRAKEYEVMLSQKEQDRRVKEAKRYHHLVSTKSVPGVLASTQPSPTSPLTESYIRECMSHHLHRHASWTLEQQPVVSPKKLKLPPVLHAKKKVAHHH